MPKIHISDATLRSLKAPETGQLDLWDKTLPTFGVRVSQGGSKTFVLKVRNSRRAIGRYPLLSLSEARTEAKRMLAEITLGRSRPGSLTYAQAVEQFVADKGKSRRARTVADYKRLLGLLKLSGQVADISHTDASRAVARIKAPSEYNHALVAAKVFFNWCQKRHYADRNPFAGLSTNATTSRTRVLSDAEVQSIWRACEGRDDKKSVAPALPAHFAAIVRLLILTGQRRGEIAALQHEYLHISDSSHSDCGVTNFGAHSFSCVILPASLTKNKREHTFPLGPLSSAIIKTVGASKLLFPARGHPEQPFSGWSKSKEILDELSGVSDWTLHDIRRTVATRMAELGVPPHVIERILNHVTGSLSPIARVYNRASFLKEMAEAVNMWEARLAAIIG